MNKTKSAAMMLGTAENTPFGNFYVVCNGCIGSTTHTLSEAKEKLSQLRLEYPLLEFKLVSEVYDYVH